MPAADAHAPQRPSPPDVAHSPQPSTWQAQVTAMVPFCLACFAQWSPPLWRAHAPQPSTWQAWVVAMVPFCLACFAQWPPPPACAH